jgi:hypothetical protein
MSCFPQLKTELQELVNIVVADDGPITQYIVNGVVTALSKDTGWLAQVSGQIAAAVTNGVAAQIKDQIEAIPQGHHPARDQRDEQGPQQVADRSAGRTRYSMLETIRQFAEEQLAFGGEAFASRDTKRPKRCPN